MTRTGTVVKLSHRDWGGLIIGMLAGLGLLVASWSTMRVSVARLEEQVNALESRITVLELTIRAQAWSLSQ